MYIKRLLSFSAVIVLGVFGLCPLMAQATPDVTLQVNVTGTVGAILAGSDPLLVSGQPGMVKIVMGESISPFKTTSTSATYSLPAGAVSLILGTTTFTTTSASSMKITLPTTGPDVVVLTAVVQDFATVTVVGVIDLKHASFPQSVLLHPAPFTPSPQVLTPATSTTSAGSKIEYTLQGFPTTILAFSGEIGNKQSQDPLLPADSDQ